MKKKRYTSTEFVTEAWKDAGRPIIKQGEPPVPAALENSIRAGDLISFEPEGCLTRFFHKMLGHFSVNHHW